VLSLPQPYRAITLRTATALGLSVIDRHVRGGRREARSRVRQPLAGLLAVAGPVTVVAQVAGRRGPGRRAPASPAGTTLLLTYVMAGALSEELLWRAPATWPRSAPVRALVALTGAVGFVAVHVHRDGPASLRVHLLTTSSWTASVLAGRGLRWSVLSHVAYNWAALTMAAAPAGR
jgi:hypothetical protein